MQMTFAHRRRGFTLAELLVVIGIIALLMTIMVPIVGKIRRQAHNADTASMLNVLRGAAEAYQQTFHAYPGPLGDLDMFNGTANLPTNLQGLAPNQVATSENLVLGLLGGLRIDTTLTPPVVFDASEVGRGPRELNPALATYKTYPPFLSVSSGMLSRGGASFKDASGMIASDSMIPEFLDRYTAEELPILYLRARVGAQGVMTGSGTALAQYDLRQILPYTSVNLLGKTHGLRTLGGSPTDRPYNASTYFANPNLNTEARSKDTFILISAGPDRIYGTDDDITTFGSVAP